MLVNMWIMSHQHHRRITNNQPTKQITGNNNHSKNKNKLPTDPPTRQPINRPSEQLTTYTFPYQPVAAAFI
ncbi:unnamed protein product [Ceratitis capitata]|uniref:(Mediterranean fruit fly) hypothetical protein n=1 Tax=Ceratitis capitata TaxID=7213 RepID=A0A811UQL1_CERCA|nr:unnamed protein product [Ceratitis capitata]